MATMRARENACWGGSARVATSDSPGTALQAAVRCRLTDTMLPSRAFAGSDYARAQQCKPRAKELILESS